MNFISELRQAFDITREDKSETGKACPPSLSSQDGQLPDITNIALPGVDVRNAGYSSPLYTRTWWQMERTYIC